MRSRIEALVRECSWYFDFTIILNNYQSWFEMIKDNNKINMPLEQLIEKNSLTSSFWGWFMFANIVEKNRTIVDNVELESISFIKKEP